MSARTDTPNPGRQGMVLVATGVGIALVGAFVLGLVLAGTFPDWRSEPETVQDLQPTQPIRTPPPERPIVREERPAPVPEVDPAVEEELRAIREQRAAEDNRRTERARLASESPLTPGVLQITGMVQNEGANTEDSGATLEAVEAGEPLDTIEAPSRERRHLLARGSVIPAVLESPIDSALPGLVRARVSETVYDTLTGGHVLIPRGSMLVGTYQRAVGAERLFVRWTDLRRPDGTPLGVEDFSSLGADGAAGLQGRRSTGILKALGAAILFDLAGNTTQILTGENTSNEGDLGALITSATGNATSRVADQYLGQILNQGARFRVRAGTTVNVVVEEDMALPAIGRER